jgi:microcystin-dependent protein
METLPPPVTVGDYPIGTVCPYAGILNQDDLATAGWLYCNGTAVSRTTYANLFALLGTAFGNGDGVSTFDLPDLRGIVARGADNGAGVDPDAASRVASAPGGNTGAVVGSLQTCATRKPVAGYAAVEGGDHTHTVNHVPTENSSYAVAGPEQAIWNEASADTGSAGAHSHNVVGGDQETVPVNAYVYYLIKFDDVNDASGVS